MQKIIGTGGKLEKGKEYEVSDKVAEILIGKKFAQSATNKQQDPTESKEEAKEIKTKVRKASKKDS